MRIDHCEFPDELLYDLENMVWVRLAEGKAVVGINSVHAAVAGKITQVKFKAADTWVTRGKSIATVESSRYFGNVRTPFTGRILSTNPALQTRPKLANDSPYENGWFVTIEPSNLEHDVKDLGRAKDLEAAFRSQLRELHLRCFVAYPDYEMWEIGVECAAVLVRLNELMERMAIGEIVHIVSDDPTADLEMERWSDQARQPVLESRKEGKLAHFIVEKVG